MWSLGRLKMKMKEDRGHSPDPSDTTARQSVERKPIPWRRSSAHGQSNHNGPLHYHGPHTRRLTDMRRARERHVVMGIPGGAGTQQLHLNYGPKEAETVEPTSF